MPKISEEQRERWEALYPSGDDTRTAIADYMRRSGLTQQDLGRRIGYARTTMNYFVENSYEALGSDLRIRKAAWDFMRAHPLDAPAESAGRLYQTENFRLLRSYFYRALDQSQAILVDGAPGTQKTYVLEHLIAELNRSDLSKNGSGRRAYLVRARRNIHPLDLMKRVAESCGSIMEGNIDRILRNLLFELRGRRVLLAIDEAHELDIDCLETIRELLDRGKVGMLLAGNHGLRLSFVRNRLDLAQWNSRLHARAALPGLTEEEVRSIAQSELPGLPQAALDKLVALCWDEAYVLPETTLPITKRAERGTAVKQRFLSARRLFRRIAEISALKEAVA
jgi:type II secretory pathway predicted ATPase ExeA